MRETTPKAKIIKLNCTFNNQSNIKSTSCILFDSADESWWSKHQVQHNIYLTSSLLFAARVSHQITWMVTEERPSLLVLYNSTNQHTQLQQSQEITLHHLHIHIKLNINLTSQSLCVIPQLLSEHMYTEEAT